MTPVLATFFTLKSNGLKNKPPEGLPTLNTPLYSIFPAACSLMRASVRMYLFWKWTLPSLKANLQTCSHVITFVVVFLLFCQPVSDFVFVSMLYKHMTCSQAITFDSITLCLSLCLCPCCTIMWPVVHASTCSRVVCAFVTQSLAVAMWPVPVPMSLSVPHNHLLSKVLYPLHSVPFTP